MNEKKGYKDIFLSFLSTQYNAFDWERKSKDMEQEVRTDFNGYGLRIASTHEGYFLQIFEGENDFIGHVINSKQSELVETIFNNVWEFINKEQENKFWKSVCKIFNEA